MVKKRKSWTKFKTVPNKWYNKKQDIELSIVQKHSLPNKKGRKWYSVEIEKEGFTNFNTKVRAIKFAKSFMKANSKK